MQDKVFWPETSHVKSSLLKTAKIEGYVDKMKVLIGKFIDTKMLDIDTERELARLMMDSYEINGDLNDLNLEDEDEDEDEEVTPQIYSLKKKYGTFGDQLNQMLKCNNVVEVKAFFQDLSNECYPEEEDDEEEEGEEEDEDEDDLGPTKRRKY